jgi:hypothetical protein
MEVDLLTLSLANSTDSKDTLWHFISIDKFVAMLDTNSL